MNEEQMAQEENLVKTGDTTRHRNHEPTQPRLSLQIIFCSSTLLTLPPSSPGLLSHKVRSAILCSFAAITTHQFCGTNIKEKNTSFLFPYHHHVRERGLPSHTDSLTHHRDRRFEQTKGN